MFKKRKSFILSAIFLIALWGSGYSQKTPIYFDAVIADKVYDGTTVANITGAGLTFRAVGEDTLVRFVQEDYEIVSIAFDKPNATGKDAATKVTVKIELNNTPFANQYELVTGGAKDFLKTISKANGFIRISCDDISFESVKSGKRPNPVIDTVTGIGKQYWNHKDTIAKYITFRYAQMNMSESYYSENVLRIPAWRSEVPRTRGTYWVEAILKDTDNYNGIMTSSGENKHDTFEIE